MSLLLFAVLLKIAKHCIFMEKNQNADGLVGNGL